MSMYIGPIEPVPIKHLPGFVHSAKNTLGILFSKEDKEPEKNLQLNNLLMKEFMKDKAKSRGIELDG